MKIIALINEKGGSGKSTVAQNLAVALQRAGKSVVLVDSDEQSTTRDWRNASPEGSGMPDVIALDRPELLSSLKTISADYVVIDAPAKAAKMTASIIRVAHVAIIPVQPSGADIWASAAAVSLIRHKLDAGGAIRAAFLPNRITGGNRLSKQLSDGEWNEYGIEQLRTTIANRTAFAQALTDGVSIFQTKDARGKKEITDLLKELEEKLWLV